MHQFRLVGPGGVLGGGSAEWAVPVGTPISRDNVPDLDLPVWYTQFHTLCYTLLRKGVRRIRNAARVPPHTIMVLVLVLVLVLGAGCWVLGAGCWVLGAGCGVLGAGC